MAEHGDIRDMLLDAAGLTLERLPMLNVIYDRLATFCADSLRHMTTSQPYFSLSSVENSRIGDVLDTYEGSAIVGVFHAPTWDSHLLVGFDRDFVFTMIEALLGSDGSEAPVEDERGFSNVEVRVARAVFEKIARALQASFGLVTDVQIKFERSETRMDFAVIGRRSNPAVVTKYLLQAINRGGEMFIAIPQSALSPMRRVLSSLVSSESNGRDPNWAKQIHNEVQRAEVEIRGVIEERHFKLGDIAALKVGQTLMLQATPKTPVRLQSNGQPLFWCRLGQLDGAYTLRIEEPIDQKQEFVDDILFG
jgi:flagellar motor switch protein FliM